MKHETQVEAKIDINSIPENSEENTILGTSNVPFSIIVTKYVFKVLLYCTAVINPIIYCFTIRSFQVRLHRLANFETRRSKKKFVTDRKIIISSLVGNGLKI